MKSKWYRKRTASFKDSKEANQKRLNKNVELGDSILKDLLAQNSEHENYYNLANKSVSTQMAGLLKKVEEFAPDGFVLDLRDNTQRQALGTVLSKFVNEQLHFKDGSTPALADYAEEMFTKIELEQYTDISPNLIAPSRAYLQDVRKVDMSELDSSAFHGLQYSNKEVIRLGETIQDYATIGNMGEQKATHLLYKDYLMYEKNYPKLFAEMAAIADSKGVGHFTQFVNVILGDGGLMPGFNFDNDLDAIQREDYASDDAFEKAQNNYIWKYIADTPQDYK